MLNFPRNRKLACITIGRANMDLYPPEGQIFAEARSYEAFVGGSPANIAAGLVRRGLGAGIITKLADDGIGEFVFRYLRDFGVDVSRVLREKSEARTSLAFAERRRAASTVFYRQQPSDLRLEAGEIERDYIAQSQVFFISGSALCREPCRSAVRRAVEYARQEGSVVAMDIDYRPHGWESEGTAAQVLSSFARLSALLIGTAEEFRLACGTERQPPASDSSGEEDSAFSAAFPQAELLVVKRSKDGANAYLKDGSAISGALLPAALKKPWGAGDAFASSLLASLLQGKSVSEAMWDGAGAASLNISGLSCTEAMPESAELEKFLQDFRRGALGPEWRD